MEPFEFALKATEIVMMLIPGAVILTSFITWPMWIANYTKNDAWIFLMFITLPGGIFIGFYLLQTFFPIGVH